MSRPKEPVPIKPHVAQAKLAKRRAETNRRRPTKLRVVAGTAAARALGIK